MTYFRSSLAIVTALVTGMVLLAGGCQTNQTTTNSADTTDQVETNIPFTREGTLTVHTGSGLEDVTLDIEIADTDSTRGRGLMQRSSLPANSGMFFIFEEESQQSFWMANTPLSLDMFFADSGGRIVTIAKYTRPGSPKHIRSEEPAQYVLETPAGFADRHGVVEGDSLTWQRD